MWKPLYSHIFRFSGVTLVVNLHGIHVSLLGENWIDDIEHRIAKIDVSPCKGNTSQSLHGVLPVVSVLTFGFADRNLSSLLVKCDKSTSLHIYLDDSGAHAVLVFVVWLSHLDELHER